MRNKFRKKTMQWVIWSFVTILMVTGIISFVCAATGSGGKEKVLVVYYSRDGHTQKVAEWLAKKFNADIERLIDKKKRTGPLGAAGAGKDALAQRMTEIAPLKHDPLSYDTILIGTPSWFSNPTPAVRTFVLKYDLRGKKIGLFGTAHLTGVEECLEKLRKLVANGNDNQIPVLPLRHRDLTDETLPKLIDDFQDKLK
jgi:flavodoxin